jgi:MraZ protein
MFRGSSAHTLDSKGRIIIPSRFRSVISEGGGDALMITSMDKCLFAYALDEWGKIEEKILSLAEKSAEKISFWWVSWTISKFGPRIIGKRKIN